MSTSGTTAMAAAPMTPDAVWYGSNTAHAVDFGQVKGCSVPVTGLAAFGGRTRGIDGLVARTAAPITGSVYPRLEGPPV